MTTDTLRTALEALVELTAYPFSFDNWGCRDCHQEAGHSTRCRVGKAIIAYQTALATPPATEEWCGWEGRCGLSRKHEVHYPCGAGTDGFHHDHGCHPFHLAPATPPAPEPSAALGGWSFEPLTGDGWAILSPDEPEPTAEDDGTWNAAGAYGVAVARTRKDAVRIVNALNVAAARAEGLDGRPAGWSATGTVERCAFPGCGSRRANILHDPGVGDTLDDHPFTHALTPPPAHESAEGHEWLGVAESSSIYHLSGFAQHRSWCPEANGPGDCTCGLYALLDRFQCVCGHKVSVHSSRDVSDAVGWPCSGCRSDRCPRFRLAAWKEGPR